MVTSDSYPSTNVLYLLMTGRHGQTIKPLAPPVSLHFRINGRRKEAETIKRSWDSGIHGTGVQGDHAAKRLLPHRRELAHSCPRMSCCGDWVATFSRRRRVRSRQGDFASDFGRDVGTRGCAKYRVEGRGCANNQAHVIDEEMATRLGSFKQTCTAVNCWNSAQIYVLALPVERWADYFARNQVRVSPKRGGIRISFAMFNTVEDVDQVAEIIRKGLNEEKPAATAQVD